MEEKNMRSKKIVLTVVMAAMLTMAGCGSKAEKTTAETTETVTVVESTQEESTQAETTEETKETETAGDDKAEADIEFTDMNKLLGKAVTSEEDDMADAFESVSEETGYLGDSADEITNFFEILDVSVEELNQFNIDLYANEQVLFHFAMYNDEALETVNTGSSDSYLTQYINGDEEIYARFVLDDEGVYFAYRRQLYYPCARGKFCKQERTALRNGGRTIYGYRLYSCPYAYGCG